MSKFSKYDVYSVAGSMYCYPGTKVLRNRFNIRNGAELRKLDADISLIRQKSLLSEPILGRFTVNHLCRIHKFLFGDIYSFSGHFRREDIMKGETRFLAHEQIAEKLSVLLSQLHKEKCLEDMEYKTFVERSAYYFAELNYIHPFREGNGRATREFMRLLFEHNGYEVNWAAVETEQMLSAMELSVYDTGELRRVLDACLRKR